MYAKVTQTFSVELLTNPSSKQGVYARFLTYFDKQNRYSQIPTSQSIHIISGIHLIEQ